MLECSLPRITVLTPSYNQGRYIEENIRCVMDQDYPNVEHIIIDGGSTDDTLDILRKYRHLKWVSEKDGGQADALNKGLAMATGDLVGWINSDDYYEPRVFRAVADAFGLPEIQWVVGNLTNVYSSGDERLPRKSPTVTYKALVRNPDIVRQQGSFFRRSLLNRVGGWNPALYMVMDYDLWLRAAKLAPPKMIDANWAYFRMHPDQKSTFRTIKLQYREIDEVLKKTGASSGVRLAIAYRKRYYLLKSRIKRALIWGKLIRPEYTSRSLRGDA